MGPTCSVCKRKQAVYYHRFSGDRLCLGCLERRLVRYIRKSFGKYRLAAQARLHVAYTVHPILLAESLAMIRPFLRAEKGYARSVTILAPRNCRSLVEDSVEATSPRIEVVEYETPKSTDPCLLERLIRTSITRALKEHSGSGLHVAIPHPREYIVHNAVYALLTGRDWCLHDAVAPVLETATARFIKPFYEISWEDMAAYMVLVGEGEKLSQVGCKQRIDDTLLAQLPSIIAAGGPELVFSAATPLLEIASSLNGKCSVCGGKLPGGDRGKSMCSFCRSWLNLEDES